jgi:hypothetical protein
MDDIGALDHATLVRVVQAVNTLTRYVGNESTGPEYVGCWEVQRAMTEAIDCVCNVGVQECPVHPGRLKTQEEKIEFRKKWDARA